MYTHVYYVHIVPCIGSQLTSQLCTIQLYMHACVYVKFSMHTCVYSQMGTCCACVCMQLCMHGSVHMHICAFMYLCMYVCACTHSVINICISITYMSLYTLVYLSFCYSIILYLASLILQQVYPFISAHYREVTDKALPKDQNSQF